MNGVTATAYAERFDKVFDYIHEHLDEELSVECLSQVANFSKFHFHRQFSQYAGISVIRYIQLMRLRRASYRLAFEEQTRVIEIALEAGFENPESFSRAFKNTFGQTPSQFRKAPAWQPWAEQYRFPNRDRRQTMNVKIVEFPQTMVAVLEHRGAPEQVNSTAKRFIEWRKASGLSPVKTSNTFGIAYDDPATTAPESFRFDICGSVNERVPNNQQGIVNKVIPAGRCAVIRHLGPHNQMDKGVYYLYREWLPESGEELRDFPLFFHYLNLLPETAEHELITDIYLPLQ
ncbi:MAG: AraC family transcriptional regulator [Gammaproteobacteria bacterium]